MSGTAISGRRILIWASDRRRRRYLGKIRLIGEKLGHSFSKPIHEQLGGYPYELMPMNEAAVHTLFAEKAFSAVNVTIPSKQTVIPLCSEVDDALWRSARSTQW